MQNKLIEIDLPPVVPRKTRCQRTLNAVLQEAAFRGVAYDEDDRLSVHVSVFVTGIALEKSDVDNLLVKVMNGLQGQVGGKGKKIMHPERRLIRNDRQVWRAQIEKLERPVHASFRYWRAVTNRIVGHRLMGGFSARAARPLNNGLQMKAAGAILSRRG